MTPSSPYRLILTLIGLSVAAASQLQGQTTGRGEIFADSDLETYIRLLQIDDKAGIYPWSIRSFSPKEIDELLAESSDHPWAEHYDLGPRNGMHFSFDLVRPSLTGSVNSAFPWGAKRRSGVGGTRSHCFGSSRIRGALRPGIAHRRSDGVHFTKCGF